MARTAAIALIVVGILVAAGAAIATPLCVELPTMSLEEHQAVLLDIYKRFASACREFDVPFWATGGTLLGAMRNSGLIPWDDDMDLEIWQEGRDVLVANEAEITAKYGITLTGDWRWNMVNRLKVQLTTGGPAWIDVFPMEVHEGKTRMVSSVSRGLDPTCYHSLDLRMVPLRNVPFEDTTVPVPEETDYLDRCYGDWRVPVRAAAHVYPVDGKIPLLAWIPVLIGVAISLVGASLLGCGVWMLRRS